MQASSVDVQQRGQTVAREHRSKKPWFSAQVQCLMGGCTLGMEILILHNTDYNTFGYAEKSVDWSAPALLSNRVPVRSRQKIHHMPLTQTGSN
jgi:hypothetical protein